MTCLFYFLATHPRVHKKLQEEVDALYDSVDNQVDEAALGKLPYLQACIDEALRLYPPVPSGLQRQTPPQGLQIGDKWIPGNTIVMTPTFTLNRGQYCPSVRSP